LISVFTFQSYFNPDVLTLVRNLVTGGVNQFLEEHIAEGDELRGGLDATQTADTRSRCKILQMSLFDGPLAQYGVSLREFPAPGEREFSDVAIRAKNCRFSSVNSCFSR